MGLSDFRNSILKVSGHRNHKVRNSYGVYDGFKFYRKNKPKDPKYILNEHQYFSIIRKVNEELVELFLNGNDITLPCRLGRLELRKFNVNICIKDGKIKTNMPIDWNRTIKLWYEDEESYKNKTLIKIPEKEVFKVYYNKNIANYVNKLFYQFNINRNIKTRLKLKIKNNELDAFIIN